jgi:hypothetical protein
MVTALSVSVCTTMTGWISLVRLSTPKCAFDLIDNTVVAVAAIGEIARLGACSRITARCPR